MEEKTRNKNVNMTEDAAPSKGRQILVLALFLCMILGFSLIWPIAKNFVDTGNHEKREFATMPTLDTTALSDFPSAIEDFINDHIPFRNQLISANSNFLYVLFGEAKDVTTGTDGWLFYTDVSDGDSLRSYEGKDIPTEKELELIASNMMETKKNLESIGCEFVIVLIPNKERVYSEYMPSRYGSPTEDYGMLTIYNYLVENTDVNVVYAYDDLMEAKDALGGTPIYYKADSHWNKLGSYIGTKSVLDALGMEFPSYDDAAISIEESDATAADLAELLGLEETYDLGKEYTPIGYELHNIDLSGTDMEMQEVNRIYSDAGNGKLYVRHDSFGWNMAEFLGANFSETVMVHHSTGSAEFVYEEDPDVFVLETVERYAKDSLLNWYLPSKEFLGIED